jgi:hypothetical protein
MKRENIKSCGLKQSRKSQRHISYTLARNNCRWFTAPDRQMLQKSMQSAFGRSLCRILFQSLFTNKESYTGIKP